LRLGRNDGHFFAHQRIHQGGFARIWLTYNTHKTCPMRHIKINKI